MLQLPFQIRRFPASAPAIPGPERLTRSSTTKRSSRVSVIVKCASQTWSRSQADRGSASMARVLRKNVSSKPKCRPDAAKRFPV